MKYECISYLYESLKNDYSLLTLGIKNQQSVRLMSATYKGVTYYLIDNCCNKKIEVEFENYSLIINSKISLTIDRPLSVYCITYKNHKECDFKFISMLDVSNYVEKTELDFEYINQEIVDLHIDVNERFHSDDPNYLFKIKISDLILYKCDFDQKFANLNMSCFNEIGKKVFSKSFVNSRKIGEYIYTNDYIRALDILMDCRTLISKSLEKDEDKKATKEKRKILIEINETLKDYSSEELTEILEKIKDS